MTGKTLQGERLEVKYVPLDQVVLFDDNPKKHDIGALVSSIRRYGFVDPPKYDAALGALVYGNGRTHALTMMRKGGEEPPRGILWDDEGNWYVPVKFGVDQASRQAAEALAVDHNNLTLSGGDFTAVDMAQMWGEGYTELLTELAEAESLPETVDGDDLDLLTADQIISGQAQKPECEISPELFERHDYLVFYFDNEFDWQVACSIFGVKTVESDKVGKRTIVHRGIGRVLPGAKLLKETARD